MSKFLIRASVILLIASCTQGKQVFAENGIKKENSVIPDSTKGSSEPSLIKTSEFSVVNSNYDTLYLKKGDPMAETLNESWKNGIFRRDDAGKRTTVILLDESVFNYISEQSHPSEGYESRLSKLTNSY